MLIRAYLRYGDLMEALGDLERGFHLKLQGLECDSTSVRAHLLIAVSCWNQRRYDDVIVWANKALDRDPQHPFAREVLGGDLDAAFEHLHRLIDARDPGLIHLAVAPQWDSLRTDPRFDQCLVGMTLRSA
jgi:tetratricopeptide (TPR) repeat protein